MTTTPAAIEPDATVTPITKPRTKRTAVPAPEQATTPSPALDTLTGQTPRGRVSDELQMVTSALRPHPANPAHRSERGFEDLAALIRAQDGVIRQAIDVRPLHRDPAGPSNLAAYEVLSGSRRLAAAQHLGLLMVPIRIHHDVDDAAALAWVLTANLERVDFTLSEQADLVQGQLDLGVSATAIAAAAGKDRAWVKQRTLVAALKPDAREVINADPNLDVLQATTIAPFADDPALVAELTAIAHSTPERLDQAAHERTIKRVVDGRRDREVNEFQALGYQVLMPSQVPGHNARIWNLSADAGTSKELTVAQHEACPHRAVYIQVDPVEHDGELGFDIQYVHFCMSWQTAGHHNRWANNTAGATSGPKSDEEKAKLAHTKATNAAAVTAEIVRHQWIRTFFQAAHVPADAAAHLARILRLAHFRTTQSAMADELAGTNSRTPMTPTQAMKHLAALAIWHVEADMPKDYWRQISNAPLYAAHLAQLQTWGYDLAPHEQDLVDADKKRSAAAAKKAGR